MNNSPYLKLVSFVGGKSHLSFLMAFIAVSVAYFSKADTSNFTAYSGIILSLCGFQHYRSIKEDQFRDSDNGK